MNQHKIDWIEVSRNTSDWAGELLQANLDKIDWQWLADNTSDWAGELHLELHQMDHHKIDWYWLSGNPSKWAGELLRANRRRINWSMLSSNGSDWAMELLRVNRYKINYPANKPIIFTYDYDQMKSNNAELQKALIQMLYHPSRVAKYLETHDDIEMYLP